MTTMFGDAGVFGKEFVDNGMKSISSLSKTAQAIATETSDYTKKSYASGAAAFEKLFSAKSLDTAVEIHTDYAKKAYEDFVAESSKLGGMYADMAKQAYTPFESAVAKAK